MGLSIYLEVKIIFRSIEHIDPPKQKTPMPRTCLIVLINKCGGLTQAVGLNSSWFDLLKLASCVIPQYQAMVMELW